MKYNSGLLTRCYVLGTIILLSMLVSTEHAYSPRLPQKTPTSSGAKIAQPQPPSGRFLLISDIHLNPLYEILTLQTTAAFSLFGQLCTHSKLQLTAEQSMSPLARATTHAQGWRTAFTIYPTQQLVPFGTDSNVYLFQSALDAAQKNIPQPDFIIYPGDFLSHQWPGNFQQAVYLYKGSSSSTPAGEPLTNNETIGYHEFTRQTLIFMVAEFKKRFGDVVIFPALGNNDSYCGDYALEPNGPFLKDFADIWLGAGLMPASLDQQEFRRTFQQGGYYTSPIPNMPNHRLVALNTILFSPNFTNSCGATDNTGSTAASTQLAWFKTTLDQAAHDNKIVWLLMHIPPGVDAYQSYAAVQQGNNAIGLWQDNYPAQNPPQPNYLKQFLAILDTTAATVQIAFAGHEHMDDFRIATTPSGKKLLTKVAPSISPIFNNNPGYQVYDYHRQTGVINTYKTYCLTNLTQPQHPHQGNLTSAAKWTFEYDFATAYNMGTRGLTAASVSAALQTSKGQQAFGAYYSGGRRPLGGKLGSYLCAATSAIDNSEATYTSCATSS